MDGIIIIFFLLFVSNLVLLGVTFIMLAYVLA